MAGVELGAAIPNTVRLADEPALRRVLEAFAPAFREWWPDQGPVGIRDSGVHLRTPVGVDADGWAQYGFVPLSAYRCGVFQAVMQPVLVPGWIALPVRGINNLPALDFEYVRS